MGEWKEYKASPWGIIPTHWKISSIKEETDVVTDYVANGSFASLAENVKYKSEKDYAVLIRLVDYNNQFRGDFVYIDKNAYEFLGKSKLYGDEIIISNVGANVGTVFRCPHLGCKMSLAPNSIMVKFNGNNDFYYYWLKSRFGQHMLKSIVTGSAQPKFNKTNFRDLQIPVPPLDEQESIASILSSLDDKIAVNKKICENLEAQAQALFKHWFIDFAPFKDGKFIDSELGLIPEGWRVGTLGDYCVIRSGFAFKSSWWQDEGVKVVKIKNITDGGTLDMSDCSCVSEEHASLASSFQTKSGDLLIAMTGATIGKFCVVHGYETYCVNQRVGKFFLGDNPLDKLPFIYCILKRDAVYKEIVNKGQGSAQPNICGKDIEEIKIIFPPKSIIEHFNEELHSSFKFRINSELESRRLASLRDTLLPKLMSGELKVNKL